MAASCSPSAPAAQALVISAALLQSRSRPACRAEFEAKLLQPVGNADDVLLVMLVHADEGPAETRQIDTRAHLRFRVSLAKVVGNTHHFAGRFHFQG